MKRKKQPTKTKAPAPVATNDRIDKRKRLFFKLLGVAGLGFFGSLLAPKKAEAYVFGSTPSTSVVGVKNSSNARVNPATEDGNLATIVTNTNKIPSQGQAVMASSTPVKFLCGMDGKFLLTHAYGIQVIIHLYLLQTNQDYFAPAIRHLKMEELL